MGSPLRRSADFRLVARGCPPAKAAARIADNIGKPAKENRRGRDNAGAKRQNLEAPEF